MAQVIWIYDEQRKHCWYTECRRKARVEVTGFDCDHTCLCLPHFIQDLADYHGIKLEHKFGRKGER